MTTPPKQEVKPIVDAATVVLVRSENGELEVFMLKRHHKSGFLGGAHVFPGGKVDPADRATTWDARLTTRSAEALAKGLAEPPETATHSEHPATDTARGLFVAAVRETFEEAGILLGLTRDDAPLEAMRDRLNGGESFAVIADEMNLEIHADRLAPYARWITPNFESRRFDTRFFVATLPNGQLATHDGTETTSAVWIRPRDAIAKMLDRDIVLAPPTLRTLEWLQGFASPTEAMEAATERPPPLVRPELITMDGGGWFLALPGDADHSEDAPTIEGATRLVYDDGRWLVPTEA